MPLSRTTTLANLNDFSAENQYLFTPITPLSSCRTVTLANLKEYQSQKNNPQSELSLSPPRWRQSSPLSPRQYSRLARPKFPPSVRKLDLYRQALRGSARQALRRHIRSRENRELGYAAEAKK
jgi:hypothetical protein